MLLLIAGNDGQTLFVTSLSFIQEPEYDEDNNAGLISQYPLEDVLDKYSCYISDFYDELNTESSQICYQKFAGMEVESIMAFLYNEEMQCYCMELNDILFSCEMPDIHYESIVNRLAEKYESKLPLIAEYIVHHDEFIEVYGEISREKLLEMMEEMTIPWIFLKDNNSGTIAYCDPDYVIEFSFEGYFEKFSDLSIDS